MQGYREDIGGSGLHTRWLLRCVVRMEGDGAGGGNGGVGRELVVYVLWVGELEEDGDGKLTYVGGSTKCILLKEEMAMEEVLRLVMGIKGSELREEKLWYSLRYDR